MLVTEKPVCFSATVFESFVGVIQHGQKIKGFKRGDSAQESEIPFDSSSAISNQ